MKNLYNDALQICPVVALGACDRWNVILTGVVRAVDDRQNNARNPQIRIVHGTQVDIEGVGGFPWPRGCGVQPHVLLCLEVKHSGIGGKHILPSASDLRSCDVHASIGDYAHAVAVDVAARVAGSVDYAD